MITKVIKSDNARRLLNYILKKEPHNTAYANKRNYAIGGHLIDTLTDWNHKKHFDPTYAAYQYAAIRSKAKNPNKKTQAYHLIFSFSEDDFPTPHEKDDKKQQKALNLQAQQAYKLVKGYLKEHLPNEAQYLVAIQRDGKGHKLHAHVAINSVILGGKTLDTNKYTTVIDTTRNIYDKKLHKHVVKHLKGINTTSDQYMLEHFKEVTGRDFVPVVPNKENLVAPETAQIKTRGAYSWREDLKDQIYDAFSHSDNLDEFKEACKLNGVTVTERHQKVTDNQGHTAKRRAFTYTFTSQEKTKTGKAKVYKRRDYYLYNDRQRGLGLSFTPQALEREFEKQHDTERQQIQEYQQQQEASILTTIDNFSREVRRRFEKDAGMDGNNSQGLNVTNQESAGYSNSKPKHDNLQPESNYAQSRTDYSESEPDFDWNELVMGRYGSEQSSNHSTGVRSSKKPVSKPNPKHDDVVLQTLINQRIINAWYNHANALEEANKSEEWIQKEREKEAKKLRQQSETKTPDTYPDITPNQRDNSNPSDDISPDY